MKNIIIALIILVVGGGAFWGGVVYEKKNLSKVAGQNKSGNMPFESRQGMQNGQGSGNRQNRMGNNSNGDFLNGEIISKDDKSITIKTNDGSSKIVYFSDSTAIGKTTEGTADDLSAGIRVMVNGKSSSDGSYSADNIQIRPEQKNDQ